MALNSALRQEILQESRGSEKWYIEIDSPTHGTLALCMEGESITGAMPWIVTPPSAFSGQEGEVGECTFALMRDAAARIATEPLENHDCRVYRYRSVWAARELIRAGKIWSDTSNSPDQFAFRVIGVGATAIDGNLPDRTFRGAGFYGYYQIPEELQKKGELILIGEVNGAVPQLVKAGGWGTLALDMPAYTHPWTGAITLDTGRGSSFHPPGLQTTISTLFQSSTALEWPVVSTTGLVGDYGYFWVICYRSEQVWEIARAWGYGADKIVCKYRGAIGGGAIDYMGVGDAVYEIGLVKIDNEIIAYRRAATSALTEIFRGINGIYEIHKRGARVQEYLPTYAWLVNSSPIATSSLSLDEIYFWDSSKAALVSNPFADLSKNTNYQYLESGQRVAAVFLFSTFENRSIGLTDTYTGNATAHENIDMDSVTTEDDSSGNWTDEGNATDEDSVDPHTDSSAVPSTSAMYSPVITEETIWFTGLVPVELSPAEFPWINTANAIDTDEDTFSSTTIPSDQQISWLMRMMMGVNSIPTGYADVYKADISIRAYWSNCISAGLGVRYGYMVEEAISTSVSTGWQTATVFAYSASEQIHPETREFWHNRDAYDIGYGTLQAAIVANSQPGLESVAYMFGAKVKLYETSHGALKCRNTGAVTNKAATQRTVIQLYLYGGTWEINYDGAWNGVTDAWHEVSGSGWVEVEIPGSSTWTADADWQKYIRIRPKYPDQTGYVGMIRMVNYYTNAGNWSGIDLAIDGDLDTPAVYNASSAGGHYGEFFRDVTVQQNALIRQVRVRIKYTHDLSTYCQVGIGAASGGSSPPLGVIWHDIAAATTAGILYIDVTNDHPTPGNWSWEDFNTGGTGRDYSIYLRVRGADGQSLEVYDIGWDVVSNISAIDPAKNPIVVNASGCHDFVLNGSYTENGGLIENPADVDRYIMQERLKVDPSRIDVQGFAALRDYFDGLCVSGAKAAGVIDAELVAGDEWLRKFRTEFGYVVDEDNQGRLTPRFWPQSTAASVATIDDQSIISFTRSRGGMEDVCNYPIAIYNPSYYTSDKSKTIAFNIVQKPPLIRRKWRNPLLVQSTESVRYQYRNQSAVEELQLIDELGNDYTAIYSYAVSSYRAYGQWFRSPFYFDYVRSAETARALVAEKIRRFAFQPWRFSVQVDPSIADLLGVWQVITVEYIEVPPIPEKTWPVSHALHGTVRAVKCVILSIAPVGRVRRLELEVI